MSTHPASVTSIVLTGLAGYLVAIAILVGLHWMLAAGFTAFLRRRYPSLSAQRAYLLRGLARLTPRLDDTQRLERIRDLGRSFAWMAGGVPALFLSQILYEWMDLHSQPGGNFHHQIIWVGLLVSLPFPIGFGPYVTARGRLARAVLQSPAPAPTDAGEEFLTFWPHFPPTRSGQI